MKKSVLLFLFTGAMTTTLFAQMNPTKESIFALLTGGSQNAISKQWKFSPSPYHTGMGPVSSLAQSYWTYSQGLIEPQFSNGLLNNAYTFRNDSMYVPENQNVTVHWAHANRYFGKSQLEFVDIALEDPKHVTAPFKLRRVEGTPGTGFVLDILEGSYLGYFQNRTRYEIVKLNEDTLYVRQPFSESAYTEPAKDTLARYFTLVKSSIVTSLSNELKGSSDVSFYPNPTKDILHLQDDVSNASIYDSSGGMLLRAEGTSLYVGALTSGLYLVKIQLKEGSVKWQKLLKE